MYLMRGGEPLHTHKLEARAGCREAGARRLRSHRFLICIRGVSDTRVAVRRICRGGRRRCR